MLQSLSIKNYALIQQLHLEPAATLNIITGETGAGKSILLGALGLLMGKRADTQVLFDKESKCVIEGTFRISEYDLQGYFDEIEIDYDKETIIRREISPSGKSRAFINDTPVTLDKLRGLSIQLMDIHSQHETLQLSQSDFQVQLLDAFSGVLTQQKSYTGTFEKFRRAQAKLADLREQQLEMEKEADYRHFILQELQEANLDPSEIEELEQTRNMAENAEEIKSVLGQLEQVLRDNDYAAIGALQEALLALRGIKDLLPELSQAYDRLQSASIEISDVADQLQRQNDLVDFDPREAVRVAERLDLIYHLQKKHHVTDINGLLDIMRQLEQEVASSDSLSTEIAALENVIGGLEKTLDQQADELSRARNAHAGKLSEKLVELLVKVGIPDAQVEIAISPAGKFTRLGKDIVNLMFSANRGVAPGPLAKVASGGEFSRLMFCVKHILADKIALPTIIFDEIDTGVSGEVALMMGEMMKFMAQNHQVISISHLPQIAARADHHYFVFKEVVNENTISNVKLLNQDERIVHIAQMIGGNDPSETALQNARELISHG